MAQIKLFTIEQAQRTLPLVRRILLDIVKAFDQRENSMIERKKLPERPNPGTDAESNAMRLEGDMEQSEHEIVRFHEELRRIGIELKDPRAGLIDFFSRYKGRIVYLCWKLDEGDTIAWWHDLEAGFRGRQPITPANRTHFKGLEPGEKHITIG